MPYTKKVCTACDYEAGERYHNVRLCPKCGLRTLIPVEPFPRRGAVNLLSENLLLRAEINALRKKAGLKPKYGDLDNYL